MPISQESKKKVSHNPDEPIDLKAIYEKVKKKKQEEKK